MRTLTPALLAAQQQASREPYVEVKVSDRAANVARLRWERLYAGGESDRYHAAAMPADGSLLRARIEPSGPSLQYQRVTSPGPGSAFGAWSNLGPVADAGVALAADGTRALLAFVSSAGTSVQVRESTNSGAAFGSPVTAATASSAITWLALGLRGDGDALLLYSVGGTVFRVKRTAGVWSAVAAWPHGASQISGLGALHAGDYHLAIAGVDTTGDPQLWTAVYGDGFSHTLDTWSALFDLAKADGGSNMTLRAPALGRPDTHRLFFVEAYSGTQAYSRPYHTWFPPSQTFAANAWREPVPFDLASNFGVAIASSATHAWLSTPGGVWRAPFAAPETDLSNDVLELAVALRRHSGHARVVLRSDDGRYNDLSAGPYASIRPGAQLAVGPGYRTTSGAEASFGPLYWIESVEHASAGGHATLTLLARDGWSLVEGWRARRQYAWAAGQQSVFQLLRFVFGRAGIQLVGLGSSLTSVTHKPSFAIRPGDDGLTAVRGLLAMVPDLVFVSGELAFIFEPSASQPSGYGYGGTHAITGARFRSEGLATNRAQVYGPGVIVEDFRWDAVASEFDLLRQVHDLNMTSTALATDRAAATLRQGELSLDLGELRAPPHCGHELYDVIDVTDANAGLSAAKYRVAGLDLRYRRHGARPAYQQRLLLGAV